MQIHADYIYDIYISQSATASYWIGASLSKCWFSIILSSRCLATYAAIRPNLSRSSEAEVSMDAHKQNMSPVWLSNVFPRLLYNTTGNFDMHR